MPRKTTITKEMILDAAFQIARESGIENVNARAVSKRLNCSTQPVMYCFATIAELRNAVYNIAAKFHIAYTMVPQADTVTMLEIGMTYVRFAAEEKHLFRLLFQSDHYSQQTLSDVVRSEAVEPMIEALARLYHTDMEEARDAFAARFLMVHGIASMLANNSMTYDSASIKRLLKRQFDQNPDG